MKQQFSIAENVFTVSAPDDLQGWKKLDNRFSPFADCSDNEPVLEIDIKTGSLSPEKEWECIYSPTYDGIGVITAKVFLTPDSDFVMVFSHVGEEKPRLWMILPSQLNHAEIITDREEDSNTPYFISHALMIAFMIATSANGTLMIHASSVIYDGKAYLFQGKSGTGKSTHSRLWLRNIPEAELLNDDNPLIRFSPDGTAMAYGSPWSGKTDCYRNISAPVGAFVRIIRDNENRLVPLSPLMAYASLTPSIFFMPFLDDKLREIRHKAIERIALTVPVCQMHCRPDADAALTCMTSLTKNPKKNK